MLFRTALLIIYFSFYSIHSSGRWEDNPWYSYRC